MVCNLASNKLIWSEVTSGEVSGGVDEATGIESLCGVEISFEFSRHFSSLLLLWLLLAKFAGWEVEAVSTEVEVDEDAAAVVFWGDEVAEYLLCSWTSIKSHALPKITIEANILKKKTDKSQDNMSKMAPIFDKKIFF